MSVRTVRSSTGMFLHLEDSDPDEVMRHAQKEYYQIQPPDDSEIESLIHGNHLRRTPSTDDFHELRFD